MADNTAAVPANEFDTQSSKVIANIEYLGGKCLESIIELHCNEEDLESLEQMQDEMFHWVLRQYGGDEEMIELPNP